MSKPFVRPDVRTFLDFVNALPNQKAYELPLAEARNMLHASRRVADAPVGEPCGAGPSRSSPGSEAASGQPRPMSDRVMKP